VLAPFVRFEAVTLISVRLFKDVMVTVKLGVGLLVGVSSIAELSLSFVCIMKEFEVLKERGFIRPLN
jgi:hypothetical protein